MVRRLSAAALPQGAAGGAPRALSPSHRRGPWTMLACWLQGLRKGSPDDSPHRAPSPVTCILKQTGLASFN